MLRNTRESVNSSGFVTASKRTTTILRLKAELQTGSDLLQRILRERRQKWEQQQLATYEAKGKKPPKNWQDKYKEPEPVDESELEQLPAGWRWSDPFRSYPPWRRVGQPSTGPSEIRSGR